MAGQEQKHLQGLVNERVSVSLDSGDRIGVLERLTPQGAFVRFDGEDIARRVASWRVTRLGAAVCTFCGRDVVHATGYRLVKGFERISRGGGGTNALRMREPTQTLACMHCVEAHARGVNPGQGGLL